MRGMLFGFLMLVFAGTACAQVNALPPDRHILVYGDAQARAIPDRFKVSVEFSAVDKDAGAARRRVEASLASVIARLHAAGVSDAEIVATSLSVGAKTRYDEKAGEQVFVGTRVERSLSARFDRKQALEQFLAGLQTSGELSIGEVETELSDEPALRDALRAKAIEETRRKAGAIAGSYGAKLGPLYSVSDVAPQFSYGIREGSWPGRYSWNGDAATLDKIEVTGSRMPSPATSVALQTGYVTFTDKIYAVFLLED